MTVDINNKIINVNNTFLTFSGYSRDEIINNLRLENFLSPFGKAPLHSIEKETFIQNGTSKVPYINLLTKSKVNIPCQITSHVVKDDISEYTHYTLIDISEKEEAKRNIQEQANLLKDSEYKLKKLTSEMQQMSITIALEIQNPLRNILGLITLLKNNYTDAFNTTGLLFLNHIADSGEKMRHHFDNLLKNSTNGKSAVNKKYVNLNEIVSDIMAKQNALIQKHDVKIQIPETLPSIFGIADDLSRLFNNLIKNAIQFKQETTSPNIKISFVEAESLYHFTIEDNGRGIDEKYHHKIFEEYFHLDPKADDCTGRGLPESRKIVENHKGTIGVISNPNKGCTIYFSLEK